MDVDDKPYINITPAGGIKKRIVKEGEDNKKLPDFSKEAEYSKYRSTMGNRIPVRTEDDFYVESKE